MSSTLNIPGGMLRGLLARELASSLPYPRKCSLNSGSKPFSSRFQAMLPLSHGSIVSGFDTVHSSFPAIGTKPR